MRRVMAQGTFDILHPGHVHYLEESAALGDELYVVVARDSRVAGRKRLYMDEASRRRVVGALAAVDEALLGSEDDLFDSVEAIAPDVITLGYDQEYAPETLREDLAAAGYEGIEVVRIGPYRGEGVTASSDVKAAIDRDRGTSAFEAEPEPEPEVEVEADLDPDGVEDA